MTWQEQYRKEFGLCNELSDKCDCNKEIKFIEILLEQQRNLPIGVSQWKEYGKKYGYWEYFLGNIRQDIIDKIETIKEKVSSQTGSYKYDDCYDDCIKVVKSLINR